MSQQKLAKAVAMNSFKIWMSMVEDFAWQLHESGAEQLHEARHATTKAIGPFHLALWSHPDAGRQNHHSALAE